jgi:hypothetical protein
MNYDTISLFSNQKSLTTVSITYPTRFRDTVDLEFYAPSYRAQGLAIKRMQLETGSKAENRKY